MENLSYDVEKMIKIKKEIEQVDKEQLWENIPPNKGANEQEILLFEKKIGFKLCNEYRNFLKEVNGWKAFWHNVDLLGIDDYTDIKLMKYIDDYLMTINVEVLQRDSLFPIAVSRDDIDMFVMIKPGYKDEDSIIWFAGAEVERFENFHLFYDEMMKYNEEEVIDLRGD